MWITVNHQSHYVVNDLDTDNPGFDLRCFLAWMWTKGRFAHAS